jgi:hypothetical protein
VYAYGIVLLELITCRTPWEEESYVCVKSKVEAGDRPNVTGKEYRGAMSNDCGRVMVELMHVCWEQHPKNRPSFTKILRQLRAVKSVAMMYDDEHSNFKRSGSGSSSSSSSYRSPSLEISSESSSYPLSSEDDRRNNLSSSEKEEEEEEGGEGGEEGEEEEEEMGAPDKSERKGRYSSFSMEI